jgi:osmoprotectant transport system substrate-binding protein
MRKPVSVVLVVVTAFALVLGACGSDSKSDSESGSGTTSAPSGGSTTVTIGAQDFGESAILAQIYGQALAKDGFKVKYQSLGGFRDIEVKAFGTGQINFAPEYAASMLEFLNGKKGEATGDAAETTKKLQTYLDGKKLVALDPSDAVDTNAFVVTKDTSTKSSLKSLSDLTGKADQLKLGGPQDCETNPFCIPGLKSKYGVDFSGNFTPLDAGLVATALEGGRIDIGVLFSTSGVIAQKGWVLLKDDKNMLAADNVVPVMSQKLADAGGSKLKELVNKVSGELTTDELTAMNKRYDIDKEDAEAIAKEFLTDHGLM